MSVAALCGACTPSTDEDTGASVTPSASQGAAEPPQSQLDEAWANEVAQVPSLTEADRPTVAVVRTISLYDYADVMLSCLHDSGFPQAERTADGEGVAMQISSDAEAKAYAIAEYTCGAQYPIDSKYTQPLSTDQLGMLYDYYRGDLSDCLRARGYTPSTAPSLAEFVENYDTEQSWSPIGDVVGQLSLDAATELLAACPDVPDGIYE